MKRTVLAIAVALSLVVAGCTGTTSPGASTAADAATTDALETASGTDDAVSSVGTVSMYVSDERNAIGDFKHLNVTITGVGFKQVGAADEETSTEPETERQPTETAEAAGNETTTVTTDGSDGATTTVSAIQTTEAVTEPDGNETDAATRSEPAPDERDAGDWIERDVDDRTFDLTTLQGPNASLLGSMDVPAGEYATVFVHVSDVTGVLASGEEVRVKLPSEKLHLNKGFTLASGDSVDFVFDITVFKAGNSGKYILKPVVSESGPDQEIDRVDQRDGGDRDRTRLEATFTGPVEPGANATVAVTHNGSAVTNASVALDDRQLGTTGTDGTLTVAVPDSVEEIELTIVAGDREIELTETFEEASTEEGQGPPEKSGEE